MRYDAIVIGAGIAGSCIAHFLAENKLKVLVIEKEKIACGASGAAGAFLSPMMGRGRLVDFVNNSLIFALKFYKNIAADLLIDNGALRIVKSVEDRDQFFIDSRNSVLENSILENGVFFKEAGVIEAVKICERLLSNCDVIEKTKANAPKYINNEWIVNDKFSAKILIASIGFYEPILPVWWLNMRGVWGERLKIKPDFKIDHNYMGDVAISATFADGAAAIGATHKRAKNDWEIDQRAKQDLLQKASDLIPQISNVKVLEIKGGMRPASIDYFPIAGNIINAHKTLAEFPEFPRGGHIKENEFSRYKNLFIFSAHGGRGFVTAPLTAKFLRDIILYGKSELKINQNLLNPDRFFLRNFRRNLLLSSHEILAQNKPLEAQNDRQYN
ncbi:MAG: FAD-binding oxidoreductase [Helicobacteraceae bacterium]|jgi:glycine/D-amino acid oxidase-like deaminating enzyme|nr:FAD-binding oxidoreductase [Helicobacteraceae bacterium]